jgi:hypothetical protein
LTEHLGFGLQHQLALIDEHVLPSVYVSASLLRTL